ncbi:MAG: phosphohydrolase [Candidatus Dactylopiibacterium carminicum]|nr:MAG: phosphohydrolase [Candidatus Dactylopiibacterium carminicum]
MPLTAQEFRPRWRVPLHIVAATASTFLLLLVAGSLVWNTYQGTREVISSATDESVRLAARALQDKIHGILRPAENQLALLAFHGIARAGTTQERLSAVPMAATVLATNPIMDAWYVGYPNGDFILFRSVRTPKLKQIYRLPEGTNMMVQMLTHRPDGSQLGEFLFYDAAHRLISRQARPTYSFDPRNRPWYQQALQSKDSVITEPYFFYTTREVGTTLARSTDAGSVVGADATLRELGEEIADLKLTAGSQVAVVSSRGTVVALEDASRVVHQTESGEMALAGIDSLTDMPALIAANVLPDELGARKQELVGFREWELISLPLLEQSRTTKEGIRVLMAVPHDELFADARQVLKQQLLISLGMVLLSVPLGYLLIQRIVQPLRLLVAEARALASFDFRQRRLSASRITEMDLLTQAILHMRSTIARFLDVSRALNSETSVERLLASVLEDVALAARARSGALYLYDAEALQLRRSQHRRGLEAGAEYAESLQCGVDAAHPVVQAALSSSSVVGRITADGPELLAVALATLDKEVVGVLVLELAAPLPAGERFRRDPLVAFVEALSSTAAVAIETRRLIEAQKALLESFIQLLAGAIDAKSPYTGGHCQRVPVLTRMLAEAADAQTEGPLRDFFLKPADWEAVHIGAWLHDCGKITTPEYVVDKTTKLETLYNRIHEIRMRFEVLKRDAEITWLSERLPEAARVQAREALADTWRTLDEEFAFVARCNVGGEFLAAEDVERLHVIAQRTWQRTLDDRLGLSLEESRQREGLPVVSLPATERLLADRPEHVTERPDQERFTADNPWGFKLEVPRHKFNRGELHNLRVARGTLTEEERYLINEHIVQTIMMLSRLPFPRHLRAVPEIAGGHHERMDGKGYPRRLEGGQMSVPARIMAIADVFEALTAADRPYKPAKLSEALGIMGNMAGGGHLDAELFRLFLRSGVYRDYADRFLDPAQCDEVDIEALLARLPVQAWVPPPFNATGQVF